MVGLLDGMLACWLAVSLACWLVICLVGWSLGRLTGLLFGWSVSSLLGCWVAVGWAVGWAIVDVLHIAVALMVLLTKSCL